ncbi:MAG: hypothetical protein RL693_1236 [Verrucomicrobiota bacterium]|jgi:hypothetical protein
MTVAYGVNTLWLLQGRGAKLDSLILALPASQVSESNL